MTEHGSWYVWHIIASCQICPEQIIKDAKMYLPLGGCKMCLLICMNQYEHVYN